MKPDRAVSPLEAEHQPEAIAARLSAKRSADYLADSVLGSIDGCVTTFAVVAGSVGGGLPANVAIILGLANLIADGFSMGASNYLGVKSQSDAVEKTRLAEHHHIDEVPEGEREEIRQIFARKGYQGDVLEKIVEVITTDRVRWIETMLTEEHGLHLHGRRPFIAGLTTFLAFVFVGAIPLVPFFFSSLNPSHMFAFSAALTAIAFTVVGFVKGVVLGQSRARSSLETLLIGGAAAALAYLAGAWLRRAYGI
jgi:VIT1/CCC1 family predicted Fe2+/Mn2+ transporter